MTPILVLVPPNNLTPHVHYYEGDSSADVLMRVEQALAENPSLPSLGRSSIKSLIYGHKESVNGWLAVPPEKVASINTVSAPKADHSEEIEASLDSLSVLHSQEPVAITRRGRKARKEGDKPKQLPSVPKIYKLGEFAHLSVGKGVQPRIVDLVRRGYNTQALMREQMPDVKKTTFWHELCLVGEAGKKYIVIDHEAMHEAALKKLNR